MKNKYILIFEIILLVFFISCTPDDSVFNEVFNQAMQEKTGRELFDALIQLDQQYPDKLVVKVNLGAMMLENGELDKARIYLERGAELAKSGGGQDVKVLLFENLAQLELLEKNYTKTVEYADKALEEGASGGLAMLKGKALYFQGKTDEAFTVMDQGWPTRGENVTQDETELYLDLLIDRGKNDQALAIIDEYLRKYEYRKGISHTGSIVAERAGKKAESVLYAYMDLEYERQYGRLSGNEIEVKFLSLKDPEVQGLVEGLVSYTRKDWKQAVAKLRKQLINHPFYRYALLVSLIESGRIEKTEVEELIKLEGYFKSFPGFYHYVWRGLKAAGVNYSFLEVRDILEKCVMMGKNTEYELPARREMGRLLGLTEAEGEKLLTAQELDMIYGYVLENNAVKELDKVMTVLSLPENVYTLAAEHGLKDVVARSEEAAAYVAQVKEKASGVLKERLGRVLGGRE